MDRTLTRRERLRRRPEFLRVQQQGVRTRGRYLTLFVLPNDLEITRLGIVATRRLGDAACRNRSKRIVREIYRLNKNQYEGPAVDIVVMPRPGFSDMPFDTLKTDYLSTLRRYGRSR